MCSSDLAEVINGSNIPQKSAQLQTAPVGSSQNITTNTPQQGYLNIGDRLTVIDKKGKSTTIVLTADAAIFNKESPTISKGTDPLGMIHENQPVNIQSVLPGRYLEIMMPDGNAYYASINAVRELPVAAVVVPQTAQNEIKAVQNVRTKLEHFYSPLTNTLRGLLQRAHGCSSSLLVQPVYAQGTSGAACANSLSPLEEMVIQPPIIPLLEKVEQALGAPIVSEQALKMQEAKNHISISFPKKRRLPKPRPPRIATARGKRFKRDMTIRKPGKTVSW